MRHARDGGAGKPEDQAVATPTVASRASSPRPCGVRGISPKRVTHHLTVILLAVVSVSGAPAPRSDFDRGEFVRWIRHYESVMGTRRHRITFLEPGAKPLYDSCAYSGSGPWVELNMNCSPELMLRVEGLPIAEKEIARHEVCHEALGHHDDKRDLAPEVRDRMESDAHRCEASYP